MSRTALVLLAVFLILYCVMVIINVSTVFDSLIAHAMGIVAGIAAGIAGVAILLGLRGP